MIIYSNLILLLLVHAVFATKDAADLQNTPSVENILCRNCGNDVSSTRHIISKRSPVSRQVFNESLFNRQDVLVQVLLSDLFFHFPVVTFLDSSCSGEGEWEESTWFPGYLMRPCVCPECEVLLGWVYQPINPKSHPSKIFFGFILVGLVGETCKYNIVIESLSVNVLCSSLVWKL